MTPLYKDLAGSTPAMPPQFGNMMQAFQQFKKTINGDPRQMVQQLLDSGRMSQQEFNQLQQTATYLQQFLK